MIFDLSVGEMVGYLTTGVVAISAFVQISPIKINPWTWLAKKIGRAINGEVLNRVEALGEQVNDLSGKVDRSEKRQDERDAKGARRNILRFGDELRIGTPHSKENFDEILADITSYEAYCLAHPEFPNNRTRATEKFITDTYDECLRENKFL